MMRRIALSTALIAVALAFVVSAQDTPPKDAAKKPNGDSGKAADSTKNLEVVGNSCVVERKGHVRVSFTCV